MDLSLKFNFLHFFLPLLLLSGRRGTCSASRHLLPLKKPFTLQLGPRSSSPLSENVNVTDILLFPAMPTFSFITAMPNSTPLVHLPIGFEISSGSLLLKYEKPTEVYGQL
ncbi:hypothetical protein L484_025938 [Morus notabilis]|uniref:Uncharacterized protein n=1 Tax=Morus notabilis TaxID=981085 RepID=W9RFM5_9ROSA|nr:hypothetical protein L484_025938 [Morus notabilis]